MMIKDERHQVTTCHMEESEGTKTKSIEAILKIRVQDQ